MRGNSAPDPQRAGLIAAVVVFAVIVAVVALFAAGTDDGELAGADTATCPEAEMPEPRTVELDRPEPGDTVPPGVDARAVVETSCGSFTIELDTVGSPRTADSFAYLAEAGVYDDTYFHRIVPDFVIQGGDPEGTGAGGAGYMIREAPPPGTEYRPGTVAMAKTADSPPGTSQAQFFVVTGEGGAGLGPEYAVVGEVVEGIDVVERIGELGGMDEVPIELVVIESVTTEVG